MLSRARGSIFVPPPFASLLDVKPKYTALLTVKHAAGDIQLSKTWEEAGYDFACISKQWARLEKGADTANALLDSSVVDPTDGRAWHVEINATQCLDEARVPRSLQNLAHWGWKFNAKKARSDDPTLIWVDFVNNPVNDKKGLQLRTEWHYDMPHEGYVVTIAKVRNVKYLPRNITVAGGDQPVQIEEDRWGISLSHRAWDTAFSKNARLAIGEGADWKPDLPTWFPLDKGSGEGEKPKPATFGVEEFLKNLMTIRGIVKDDQGETYDGMTID